MSHGTGMGYSTVAGFWIPDKAPPPPPKEAPARAALKGATASKLKMHTAAVSKGAKRLSGKPVSTKKHDSADRKPPQVNVISRLPILHSGISEFQNPTLGSGLESRFAVMTVYRSQKFSVMSDPAGKADAAAGGRS